MPRTEYQHFINIIGSEIIAEPRMRWLFAKIFHSSKFGYGTTTWPGGRIYSSTLGKRCGLGMGANVIDSVVGDETVICAKAVVRNAVIGKECFIATNSRVTGTIPDRTFVTGTNKCRKRDFQLKPSRRNITLTKFKGFPIWNWEVVLQRYGVLWMLSLMPHHFFTNSFAQTCKSARAKKTLSKIYCNVSDDAFVHYSAVLDPIFPGELIIKKGAYIDGDTLLLAHSFVNESGYILEKGPTIVGENSRVGRDSVMLPGVSIPDNVDIPPSSVVTHSGPFLVEENRKLKWESISK